MVSTAAEAVPTSAPRPFSYPFTLPVMHLPVAVGAQCQEVLHGVVPQPRPRSNVVNLEIEKTPTGLTSPAIASQHLVAELAVGFWIELEPGSL